MSAMILLEIALAILLVWFLASCSLIIGGCISICALRLNQSPTPLQMQRLMLYNAHPNWSQKSNIYID